MKLCLSILGTKEWKQFAALKHSIHNLGKCLPFPPEQQFEIIEYAMGTKVFFPEKNEPLQSSREQWWIRCGSVSRAHLVLLLFTSLCNLFSHQLHPVTKRVVFKAGGHLKACLTLKKF